MDNLQVAAVRAYECSPRGPIALSRIMQHSTIAVFNLHGRQKLQISLNFTFQRQADIVTRRISAML